jgi:hypothetical protein
VRPVKRERLLSAAAVLALVALNAFVTLPLFAIDYTSEMGSIEAAFISLARYIVRHFPDFNWFPLWYGGIPFPDSYPPLLHFVVAGAAAGFRVGPGLAYHAVTAAIYALAPATLFWAARRLGASRVAAFGASLAYSLASPACWLVRDLRVNSFGWFGPHRLMALARLGETPHQTALLLLPAAIALLHVALEKRRPFYYAGATLAMAAVALTNWIGAFALAVAVACYLLAAFRDPVSRWLRTAAMGCCAYAVAMPWLPPSTIATIRANAPLVGGKFESNATHRWVVAALTVGMILAAWAMRRWKLPPQVRFAALFLGAMAAIALGFFWFQFSLLPQSNRYHYELDLAFCLAAALAAGSIRISRPAATMAVMLLLSVPIVLHERRIGWGMEKPIDIRTTVEYRESVWLGEHMPGRRVFAPGTIAYWMNAFSETPMLAGGFDNGERNLLLPAVIYQIYFGDQREVALDWLKAFGCDAVIGGGPRSREVYHPYRVPGKFAGLPELWREGDDVIYAVPRPTPSLAHAVRAADLPATTPEAYDTTPLKPYLRALDDPALPPADFRWRGTGAAEIAADLRPEHLLSVQVTWDAGWSARVNGEPRRVWGDKLGQMVVEPRCHGVCRVDLAYDGGAEMRAARWLSGLTLGGGALWVLLAGVTWKRRLGSTRTN